MRNTNMDPLLQQLLTANSTSILQQQQQQLEQMLLGSFAASLATPSTSTATTGTTAHPSLNFDMNSSAFQSLLLLQQFAMQNSPGLSPTIPYLPLHCHPLLSPVVPVTTSTASTAPSTPDSSAKKSSNKNLAALQSLTLQVGQPTPLPGCSSPSEMFSISSILNMSGKNVETAKSPVQQPAKPQVIPKTVDDQSIMALINSANMNRKLSKTTPTSPVTASPIGRIPISAAEIISMMCQPVLTPNGNVPASSPSTSQSSVSSKNADKEEEDEDLFVDVESIDVAIDGKDRRKAHVEFYRKIKSMRQREKVLTCAVCKKKVENVENTIQTHVNEHADAGVYQCRICGWQSNDKYRIYEHMRKEHPGKVEKFQDKRDMPKMCQMMVECFPRPNSRPKKESDKSSDIYLSDVVKLMDKHGLNTLDCEICKTAVRKEKQAIIRHVQNSHTLKCKRCKIITVTIDEQLEHQRNCHDQTEPKMSVHYAPSAAAVLLLPALEKCFPMPA